MPLNSPILWVVATPIGNPFDLSARAREVLATADLILAEDTRKARFMLEKTGIAYRKITSFFEHNELQKQPEILNLLKEGKKLALITDAGTPLLSDPGYRLVRACRDNGIRVSPVPGPSAPVAAISAAGLPPIPYTFLGFMPRSASAQESMLKKFASVPGSLVFFERKNRLAESFAVAYRILGCRPVAICRELTKEHEEFIFGNLSDLSFVPNKLLGEITVIIGPAEESKKTAKEEIILLIDQALDEELKPRIAAKIISEKCEGWSADEIYAMMEAIKKQSEEG